MEFKYRTGSKTLEDIKTQYEHEEMTRRLKPKDEIRDEMENKGYLHSAQELIDYVLGGGCLIGDDDCYSEWMKLVNDKIVHHKMFYNDIDLPVGFGDDIMTIDEFKDWANLCEKHQKENGSPFVNEYFHKDLDNE